MEEVNYTELSDQDLLLIVSHEDDFEEDLFLSAKEEWENRNLPSDVVDRLIKNQDDFFDSYKIGILDIDAEERKVEHLKLNGISEKVAVRFGVNEDSGNVMSGVIYLGLIILSISLLYKFAMNFIG